MVAKHFTRISECRFHGSPNPDTPKKKRTLPSGAGTIEKLWTQNRRINSSLEFFKDEKMICSTSSQRHHRKQQPNSPEKTYFRHRINHSPSWSRLKKEIQLKPKWRINCMSRNRFVRNVGDGFLRLPSERPHSPQCKCDAVSLMKSMEKKKSRIYRQRVEHQTTKHQAM